VRLDRKEQKRFQRHMRDRYQCAVNDSNCCKAKTVTWLNRDVESLIGNSITLCRAHAIANWEQSLSTLGRKDFERTFLLDLAAIAEWCQWDFEGQLSFGEAPDGVNYA